jgi:hypothetical protein
MTTIKQKIALEKLVENGGNVTRAMIEAGYSEATANNPSNLTHSEGFRSLLKQYGLDESFVVTALVEDIKGKPLNRSKELFLASEILGMRKNGALSIKVQDNKPVIVYMPQVLIEKFHLN